MRMLTKRLLGEWWISVERHIVGYTYEDVRSLRRKIRDCYRTGAKPVLTQWERAAMENGKALPRAHMIRKQGWWNS